MKVLFVSVLYMPVRMPSDKQFVRDLIAEASKHVTCSVWTVNDMPQCKVADSFEHGTVPVYTASRFLHRPRYEFGHGKPIVPTYSPHKRHSQIRQSAELISSFCRRLSYFKRVVATERPDIIHLTDNWGPIVPIIKQVCPGIPITSAKLAARVNSSDRLLYKWFLRSSMSGCDKIICLTDACKEQIVKAGIEDDRTVVIPWGIVMPESELDNERIKKIKRRYGCKSKDLLMVASIQTGAHNFTRLLHDIRCLSRRAPVQTVVAVKPDHWRPEYSNLVDDRLTIERGPSDFLDLLWAADIMFSPTYDRYDRNTATPPLTWLEAMARGTILATTPGYGVEECVHDGKTGFLFSDVQELHDGIKNLLDKNVLHLMKTSARELAGEKYSVKAIATRYLHLWGRLIAQWEGRGVSKTRRH